MSTSKTKCTFNSSKDLKTYKRPLQTITKYFAASSGSNGKPPMKLADSSMLLASTKGTLFLHEYRSSSSPNSSGVFKVTANPTIDISENRPYVYLLNDDLLINELSRPKPKEQFKETAPDNVDKRTNNESSEGPAKKRKKLPQKAKESRQQSSSSTEFTFEYSEDEDEDEKKVNPFNGDKESPNVYFCKHCDYSNAGIRHVSTHYQNDHPYIRYNAVYILDPSDQSATFRCLECPVEFLSIADLKRHYTENHPEAPNVFTRMQSRDLSLVFKCFVCPFTTNALKVLKKHYEEKHPTHKVDNSLMYCRYSAGRCQEESSQLNPCEKVPSPERPGGISPESACTPCEDVKNAPRHPTSKGEDVALYYCKKCKFCHTSVVVLQVHYQKSHPDEAVTIDKIKQSARVTSHTTSQMMPDKSPDAVTMIEQSTPQKIISDPSKGLSQQNKTSLSLRNLKHTPEASKTYSESPKTKEVESAGDRSKGQKSPTKRNNEMSTGVDSSSCGSPSNLFYCQYCSYTSTNIRSVVGHHNVKHSVHALTCIKEIICYSAEMQKKKLQSEAEASASTSPSDSKTSKQVEVCSEKDPKHDEDEAANAYACAENLFYCQMCNYGNPTLKGVLSHQARVHQSIHPRSECINEYSALVRDKIEKSKSQAKELSFATNLPLPLMNEGDKNMFFCHFCNYRQSTVDQVMQHYYKRHHTVVTGKHVLQYTAMVLKQTQKSHPKPTENQEVNHASLGEVGNKKKKTKKLGKEVSASPSTRASQTQRTLQCHRCPYNTQYVYLLRRHLWKTHKVKPSIPDVLKVCFEQGTLQTGYHCDMCVFSHKKASAVHEHHQQQHPGRKRSLKYVTTRLYAGPQTSPPEKRKPHIKHTDGVCDGDGIDGSLTSQRSGQNKTKSYSCRACTFKGSSMSSITLHYRAVHPWSLKEDVSVLDVINTKRPNANRQVEDHNETPGSFDTYQVPLEFDHSPGTFHEATISSTMFKCSYCHAIFKNQHGLNTHCGMKHRGSVTENLNEWIQEQVQTQTSMHVFKCQHCTYINTSYQGVLSHCQMKHPALSSRADSLHMDDTYLHNVGNCLKTEGPPSKLSGYMCKTCPQIYTTLQKLNKHCNRHHIGTVANTLQPAPKLTAVSKKKQSMTHKNHGTVSKASFLSRKICTVIRCQHCAYSCSTKIALDRHLRLRHKNASVSKARDNLFRCALCYNSYFRKKRLGSHYAEKHGKESFLKYFAPLYMQDHKKPAPMSLDCPLTPQRVNTSQACESSTATEENIILVYKCPSCPYVNASHHGTLTHCQMRHPALVARAGKLQTDEILVTRMAGCKMGKGSNERGYMCRKCPQIYVSLKKLKIHCSRDHAQAEATASEHSDEIETEKQPDHSLQGSELEALSLKNKTSVFSTTEIGLSHQLSTPETFQSNTPSRQDKESLYNCHICTYTGWCRKYLYCHYKKTHKLDAFTIYKLLEKYNKYKRNKASNLSEAETEESAPVKCKMCPNLTFDSSQLLIAHYSTFHSADSILDFTVLSKGSKKTTGLYNCAHCMKRINGIRNLCLHLDRHRECEKMKPKDAETKASVVITSPEAKSIELCRQDELPTFETVQELIQWNVTPVEIFTLPPSPLSAPSEPTDLEQAELEPREYKHTCKQCGRTFMSLKGLRSHERSHAAVAAIKKLDNLPTSASKQTINKYVLYKSGTLRPFLCSFCSYRTTVMGLWRSHFMKKHQQDVLLDPAETDNQDEESAWRADKEPPYSSEELNSLPELDEEPEITEKPLYLEPPDVQRQLNQYSLMAQAGAPSKATVQETKLPENRLLHCEVCNFNTGHLSSMRRHYLNHHGKKILRCKDCNFFTGFRKTLEMHMETGHSTCQSEATHQKDLRCPFCLYQTKNKNNMIDHIILHREERFVSIEVCRPKLSRYLQGIVFRCHKCTFTSGSAENLHLHMMRHDDIKPFKCRLCYFDCTQLSDLEAHLSDKHQVERNHKLVGQVSLDQLEARVCRILEEEPLFNLEHHNNDSEDVKTEFVMDCNKGPHERSAENPAENNIREKIKLQLAEANRKQVQDDKSCVSDLLKPNTPVQEKHEQDPQEHAGIVFLPDNARGQGRENIQFENSNGPEKQRQTNENQAQAKLRDGEDSSISFTQQKEEAAEGSSTTYGKIAERAQAHKLQIKALQHRTLNIEARVEEDIQSHILLLDEDGSNRKTHKKPKHDKTIEMEQNIEMILDEESSITLAHNLKNQVNTEAISAFAKKNHLRENKIRAQESFTVKRNLLTLTPNCAPPKISPKEKLGASFPNCKEEQVHNQKNHKEARDTYGERPVLENEYLKEEKHPIGCCKEEDQNDHLEQKQDKDEMITEDNENRCANREHEEVDGIEEAANPHVPKGALTVTDGAAEVMCPATAEEKLFTCEFCGRNLMNSSELECHVMRHGI